MLTFVAAYMIVWAAVLGYVVRLAAEHRRLQRAVDAIEAEARSSRPHGEPLSDAA